MEPQMIIPVVIGIVLLGLVMRAINSFVALVASLALIGGFLWFLVEFAA